VGVGFAGHASVNHWQKEYARGDVTTNHAEGYFRGWECSTVGIDHRGSRPHLHRHVSHMEFLHNQRHMTGRRAHADRYPDGGWGSV
jgi:hypothetical protein